jgi:DNA-binding LytR/AlgR family response regulator
MNAIIIEDEHYAAEKLKNELRQIDKDISIIVTLDSCEACLEFFKDPPEYDLIFSDIHLSDGLCFNVFCDIKIDKPIIFTTAYDKYALQAFEANGIDYLLKPIQSDRLRRAIEKYNQLQISHTPSDTYQNLKELLTQAQKEYKSRFLCKLGNKIKSIPVSSIRYFYSRDKMTFIVDEDHSRFPVNHTLDEIDGMLDPKTFFRLNRQYITHYDAIHEIHPYFKGRLKLKLNPAHEDDIVVSTERSPLLKSWLDR